MEFRTMVVMMQVGRDTFKEEGVLVFCTKDDFLFQA